ncbi:NimC/NimA family protein [Intestinibacillus massiliensis]|nr:NimC/NimA family protein [Intestinibacillus massiliensis]
MFYVATDDLGQPRVWPLGAVTAFEGKLYLIRNDEKQVYKQMQANLRIEICAMDPQQNWLRIVAVVVTGPRREARQHMLDDKPTLKELYSADDGKMEVLYLKDVEATFCPFTSEPGTVKF